MTLFWTAGILALLLTLVALLLPGLALAADGGLDPAQANAILGATLTTAGAVVASTIVAAIIQVLKSLRGFGAWLEGDHEYVLAIVLDGALIGYAAWATGYAINAVSGFGLLLAWLGLVKLTGTAYDTVVAAKAGGLAAAIKGG